MEHFSGCRAFDHEQTDQNVFRSDHLCMASDRFLVRQAQNLSCSLCKSVYACHFYSRFQFSGWKKPTVFVLKGTISWRILPDPSL
jgi:hypothetical protein